MKITLPTITNGQDLTTLNNNFASIASALNTNVLYRKNIAGEDNTMQNDLDFNGFRAYNLTDVLVNGVSVATVATNAQNAANAASASAAAALASQISSASSQSAAAQSAVDAATAAGAAGSLIAANNLSDVPNKTAARANLVLDQVNNTSDTNKPVSTAQQTALNLKLDSSTAASTYLTQATATATYLSIATASSTYATIANLNLKAPLASASATGTWNFAGLIIPTSSIGIKGTVAADNAQAGSIGEVLTAAAGPSAVVTATTTSVGSLVLTAGDWDVQVVIAFTNTGGATIGAVFAGVSSTINTFAQGLGSYQQIPTPAVAGLVVTSPTVRYNVSTNTTVWPTGNVNFTAGTCTMQTVIYARRVR